MAFNNFFCRSGGSNLNAGSRDGSTTEPGTTPDYEYASGNYVQSTGVFTVASGDPSSDGVQIGDYASIYADGSTETDFVARVTAVSSTTITVDIATKYHGTNPTDGTGNRTLRIGGAWAGPSGAVAFPMAQGWLRYQFTDGSGTYPRLNIKSDVTPSTLAVTLYVSTLILAEGYETAAGDMGAKPVFTWTGAVDGVVLDSTSSMTNMHVKSTNVGSYIGVRPASLFGLRVRDVISEGWVSQGFFLNVNGWWFGCTRCVAISCGTGFYCNTNGQTPITCCIAIDCTTGFRVHNIANAVASGCTTGFSKVSNTGALAVSCDAYDCTMGFDMGAAEYLLCNAVSCTTGFATGSNHPFWITACGVGGGAFANGTDYETAYAELITSLVEYQTHPWVDPANNDFRLDASKLLSDGVTSVLNQGYVTVGSEYNGNVGAPSIGALPVAGAGGGLLRVGMNGGFGG